MKRLAKWRADRAIVETTYTPPKMTTSIEGMLQHILFISTCTALNLCVVRTDGPHITVSGQARNVAAFNRRMAVVA